MNYRNGAGVLLAVLLATSACDKEPTGQSVAVVNGVEISEGELNEELAAANIPSNVDKKEVMPQLLQRIVDRKLVALKASEEGLDKSPDYLSRQRRLNENLLIGMYTQKQAESLPAPTAAEIDAFIAGNPNMFEQREMLALNQLAFERPADMTLLQQLQNDHSLDAVGATLTRLGIPFQKGGARLDTASLPPATARQINGLPAGEPFVVPSGNRIVVSVIAGRQAAVANPEESRRVATEALRRQKLAELLEKQVKDLKAAAKVEYQPGYEPKAADKAGAAAGGAPAPAASPTPAK